MDYYRSNIAGGIVPSNVNDTNNTVLNAASDSYASNYWNIPYSDGLSPMKQIEGKLVNQSWFWLKIQMTEISIQLTIAQKYGIYPKSTKLFRIKGFLLLKSIEKFVLKKKLEFSKETSIYFLLTDPDKKWTFSFEICDLWLLCEPDKWKSRKNTRRCRVKGTKIYNKDH